MIVRLCGSGGAYEAFPERSVKLDLKDVARSFKVVIQTPILLIVKDTFEVSIFKNGRLLIKNCSSLEKAEEQASKVYKKLFENS